MALYSCKDNPAVFLDSRKKYIVIAGYRVRNKLSLACPCRQTIQMEKYSNPIAIVDPIDGALLFLFGGNTNNISCATNPRIIIVSHFIVSQNVRVSVRGDVCALLKHLHGMHAIKLFAIISGVRFVIQIITDWFLK